MRSTPRTTPSPANVSAATKRSALRAEGTRNSPYDNNDNNGDEAERRRAKKDLLRGIQIIVNIDVVMLDESDLAVFEQAVQRVNYGVMLTRAA
jgi:hypothetical protein